MSNVIPEDALRKIGAVYRARSITAASLVALTAAALCAAALLPSYLALYESDRSVPTRPFSGAKSEQQIRDELSHAQSIVSVLLPLVSATTTPVQAAQAALSARPASIRIDRITYTGGEGGALLIGGKGASRESINAYRKALDDDPHFTSVSVPVGDLAGTEDGRFSITLSGNFK